MKKLLFAFSALALMILSGCQQLQTEAEKLRKQGEQAINGFSQQADGFKTQVLKTKAQFDEKSQQVVNTMNDFNKLTH